MPVAAPSRLLFVALLAAGCAQGPSGPTGPQGPEGPQGPAGDISSSGASISGVVPSRVVSGRTYEVVVSGFGTQWSDAAQVSFGPGITTTKTVVASPTSLVVTITVAPDATAGTREITVAQGETATFWRGAFQVVDTVEVQWLGKGTQMSMSVVRFAVNDPGFEFDTTESSFGGFSNLSIATSPSFPLRVLSASGKQLDLAVLVDADAGVGPYDVTVVSRPGSLSERTIRASDVFTVSPAQEETLTYDAPVTGSIAKPFESTTYAFSPSFGDGGYPSAVVVSVQSSKLGVTPRLFVLPGNGSFNSLVTSGANALFSPQPNQTYHLIAWDSSGASGYPITVSAAPMVTLFEEEPNDTIGQAQALPVPGVMAMSLQSETDIDFVKIAATAADVGRRVHVITRPGDDETDTLVEVLTGSGTSLGGESADDDYHEDHFSDAIPAAGDYLVKVTLSPYAQGTLTTGTSHYELVVTIE